MTIPCHTIRSCLPALQDGELTPEAELQLRSHLRDCPQCQQLFAALEVVHRGLAADAAWCPERGVSPAVAAPLTASPARVSRLLFTRRQLRWLAPVAAVAAGFLVLAIATTIRSAGGKSEVAQESFFDAPRIVVDYTAAIAAAVPTVPEPSSVSPAAPEPRVAPPTPPAPPAAAPAMAVPPTPPVPPPTELRAFEIDRRRGAPPVGRAFVVEGGQVRPYDGAVAVTIDRMPTGPAALRVDAFPRAPAAADRKNKRPL
jgi:hypothetical protein